MMVSGTNRSDSHLEKGQDVQYSDLLDLDKYMLHRLSEFMSTITQHYDNYSFGKGVNILLS